MSNSTKRTVMIEKGFIRNEGIKLFFHGKRFRESDESFKQRESDWWWLFFKLHPYIHTASVRFFTSRHTIKMYVEIVKLEE